MEVSSPCISCVLIRTSEAINYPKLTSIAMTTSNSGRARRMGSVSGSGSKPKRGQLWYLVKWKGFSEDPERKTWEPASNITNSPDLFKDFHSLYPEKHGPITSRVLFSGAWWGLDLMKVSSSPGIHL
ncbi:hypothetical protein O181_015205 [Austropuccinia psidii MF-1]|uniref:Chromo domain-containing protein n=1 Tax=Austropuccinia psidii MF-1 TaxID=1389203 RepID=A0A9Q3C2F8_9BASI|nr:hypothetical protein [Austropuccinia psidii MF-1]